MSQPSNDSGIWTAGSDGTGAVEEEMPGLRYVKPLCLVFGFAVDCASTGSLRLRGVTSQRRHKNIDRIRHAMVAGWQSQHQQWRRIANIQTVPGSTVFPSEKCQNGLTTSVRTLSDCCAFFSVLCLLQFASRMFLVVS